MSSVPSLAAGGANPAPGGVPLFTPPQTPGVHAGVPGVPVTNGQGPGQMASGSAVAGVKRESAGEGDEGGAQGREKKRRIAPTLVSGDGASAGGGEGGGGG